MTKLLIPYVTGGFPSKAGCRELLDACVAGGADRVELGVPFSDPMADGPVIQQASQEALARGFSLADALAVARTFRAVPIYLMTYLNPILARGLDRYFAEARRAGVAGTIVPDLPPEEARGRPLVHLCAPTCTDDRIRRIDRASRDFIYLVSIRGVTGARRALPSDLGAFIRRVRRLSRRPLCVGFGISTPAQAAEVAKLADGVIVGSAVIRAARAGGPQAVERLVRSLRRALDQGIR